MKKESKKLRERLIVAIVVALVFPSIASAQWGEISKQQYYQYLAAAKKGNAEAQYVIGQCHREFHSECSQDKVGIYGPGAFEWFHKAAEQGHAAAQYELGNICYFYACDDGGTRDDVVAAVQWWTKSAKRGYAAAQYMLGECYFSGTVVTKNYATAVYWFREAARKSNEDAIRRLKELGESW